MIALTLETAKTVAVVLVIAFVVGSLGTAWLMKTIIQKVAVTAVLLLFAFGVWTQRTSLQDCADKVQDSYSRDGVNPAFVDTDCSFFGTTITISDPRSGDSDTDG